MLLCVHQRLRKKKKNENWFKKAFTPVSKVLYAISVWLLLHSHFNACFQCMHVIRIIAMTWFNKSQMVVVVRPGHKNGTLFVSQITMRTKLPTLTTSSLFMYLSSWMIHLKLGILLYLGGQHLYKQWIKYILEAFKERQNQYYRLPCPSNCWGFSNILHMNRLNHCVKYQSLYQTENVQLSLNEWYLFSVKFVRSKA